MHRRFVLAIVIGVAVLAGAEIAARIALPDVPSSSNASRNPFRFRGWPEYMAPIESADGTADLILLSNSQAYALEVPEKRIYPALLEEMLTEQKVGGFERWEVHNWSIDGTTSMEHMLLAARLMSERPTVVLAAIGSADFRGVNFEKSFSYCRSDVPRLLAHAAIVRVLPASFLKRHYSTEDILTAWATDRSAMLRYRDYMWSWLDKRYPAAQPMFYSPMLGYHPWEVRGKPRVRRPKIERLHTEKRDFTFDERSGVLLKEYLELVMTVPADHVIVVAEPSGIREGDPVWPPLQNFQAAITRLAGEIGFTFWDLHEALPFEGFSDGIHFKRVNHRRFAKLLTERLGEELGR